MRKIKELLLFMGLLLMPILLLIVIGILADGITNRPSLIGFNTYIKLFLNDKAFYKAVLNTVAAPLAISFLFVFAFALLTFFIRKKIKMPRLTFYITSSLIGTIISVIYNVYINMNFLGTPNQVYASHTLVTHIYDYSPSIFDYITIQNLLFSLFVGILTAFAFWILEQIVSAVKKIIRKRNTK